MSREIKFRIWDHFNGVMAYPAEGRSFPKGYIEDDAFILDQCVPLQFTGLHDKNGKEIYEGDVIEVTDGDDWINGTEIVIIPDIYPIHHDCIGEVIGNIYENGDLLK